ncbi:hypothetical protein ES705_34292 [subsurface metagenome]
MVNQAYNGAYSTELTLQKAAPQVAGAEYPSALPGKALAREPSTKIWRPPSTYEDIPRTVNGYSAGQETAGFTPTPLVTGMQAWEPIEPLTLAAFPLIPLIAGAGAGLIRLLVGLGGKMSLGFFKTLLQRFGPNALKLALGGAVFGFFMDLVDGGLDDSIEVPFSVRRKPKRYTIGNNPRVKTLQRVARHTMKLLKRHDKYIKEFFPKKVTRYGIPPAKALSAIEKAAIRGGT